MSTTLKADKLEPGDLIVLKIQDAPTDVVRIISNDDAKTVSVPEAYTLVEPLLVCMTWAHGLRETHMWTYTLFKRRQLVTLLTDDEARERAKRQVEER